MLDFSASEWFLVCVIALIVIGPKELPAFMNGVGRLVARVRSIIADAHRHLNLMTDTDESALSDQINAELEDIALTKSDKHSSEIYPENINEIESTSDIVVNESLDEPHPSSTDAKPTNYGLGNQETNAALKSGQGCE